MRSRVEAINKTLNCYLRGLSSRECPPGYQGLMWGRVPGEKSQLPRHLELSWSGAHAVPLGNVLKLPETL